jgi:hypothetical protein
MATTAAESCMLSTDRSWQLSAAFWAAATVPYVVSEIDHSEISLVVMRGVSDETK